MTILNLIIHNREKKFKKHSQAQKDYSNAKNLLSKYTVVHETDGNKFETREMNTALELQKSVQSDKECSGVCCRLKALKNDLCYLHNILRRQDG